MYPSITENLLRNALQLASQHTQISKQDFETIMGCKTSLLYDIEKNVWKKKGTQDFDITMSAYNRAYKDDWLAASSQTSRCTERARQEIDQITSQRFTSATLPGRWATQESGMKRSGISLNLTYLYQMLYNKVQRRQIWKKIVSVSFENRSKSS